MKKLLLILILFLTSSPIYGQKPKVVFYYIKFPTLDDSLHSTPLNHKKWIEYIKTPKIDYWEEEFYTWKEPNNYIRTYTFRLISKQSRWEKLKLWLKKLLD